MTCFGPDGSHHQDGMTVSGPDWEAIDFVLWRSSIGSRVDRTFAQWRDLSMERGKAFCAYHFVYRTVAGAGWSAHPAERQADTVELALNEDRSVPIMLDWEHDGSQVPTWDDVNLVAAALRARGYRVPLLYTGRWYWDGYMGRPTLAGHGFDLVNSNYGSRPTNPITSDMMGRYLQLGGDTSTRWNGYGGLDPVIWQFGSQVRWGDRHMDMNVHRGPVEQLNRWFWTPPPPPPEEDEMTETEMQTLAQATAAAVWQLKLATDPSGVAWPAEQMLGWLRRDVVQLRQGLLGPERIAELASAVAAKVDIDEATAREIIEALAAELAD
jgi:lysozyme